jgi:hypothetical protein
VPCQTGPAESGGRTARPGMRQSLGWWRQIVAWVVNVQSSLTESIITSLWPKCKPLCPAIPDSLLLAGPPTSPWPHVPTAGRVVAWPPGIRRPGRTRAIFVRRNGFSRRAAGKVVDRVPRVCYTEIVPAASRREDAGKRMIAARGASMWPASSCCPKEGAQ